MNELESLKIKYRKTKQEVDELEEQLSAEQSVRSRGAGSNWNSPLKIRGSSGYTRSSGTGSSGRSSGHGLVDSFKLRDEPVSC